MKLYTPQKEFYFKEWNGKLNGTWVGSEGLNLRQIIVPIKVSEEESPDPEKWGVRSSTSGRPLIVANHDPTAGCILKLSAYYETGKAVGYVYVDHDQLESLFVIATGIGGDGSKTWQEAIVRVSGETTFICVRNDVPDLLVVVSVDGNVLEKPVYQFEVDSQWVRIDDPDIARWNVRKEQENLRKDLHDSIPPSRPDEPRPDTV